MQSSQPIWSNEGESLPAQMLYAVENMVTTTVKIVNTILVQPFEIFIIPIRHGGSEVNIQSCRNECKSFSLRV